VLDIVNLAADEKKDRIALLLHDQSISYGELNRRSDVLASKLIQVGFQNASVGICFDRSFDLIISIIAVLKAGCTYVPFDPTYPRERIAYMVEKSKVNCLICDSKYSSIFSNSVSKIIDSSSLDYSEENSKPVLVKSSEEQAVYILFTSGSTGNPKGVELPHRALSNLLQWQIKNSVANHLTRTLQFAPISFDVSFQEIFSTFYSGGTLVLIDDETRLNTVSLLNYIHKYQINRLFLPFIALQHICDVAAKFKEDLSCLSEVITAGEQLKTTKSISTFFKKYSSCSLYNHYGPTETHVITSYKLPESVDEWTQLPAIGKPIDNSYILILDDEMNPVKNGDVGEMYLGGICLANGYAGSAELTAERFIQDPFNSTNRLYRSGDLGKILEDGNIEYIGRADHQVKIRGHRIELGEVETVLGKMNGVSQVICSVKEDEVRGKRLFAYYKIENQVKPSIDDWMSFAREHLPDYMVPSNFIAVEDFAKTPSGKIDRKLLPEPNTNRPELKTAYSKPVSDSENLLCQLWENLLDINSIGIDDNFFDLGGTSLSALKCLATLSQDNGIELSVAKFYQSPYIRSLADYIDNGEKEIDLSQQAKERNDKRSKNSIDPYDDAIAVIGMAIKFPGADTIDEFWNNLYNGIENIKRFSKEELHFSIPDDIKSDPLYVAARGVLDDAEMFDSKFFSINPRIADLSDPQQRIFLQLCWNAFENAGYKPGPDIMTGVFAGTGNNTYYLNNVHSRKDLIEKVGAFQVMTANEKDYVATKVAYELNLKGPALSIHTACSTSLVAICNAVNSLRNFECDMALAGAASVTSPVNSGVLYQEGGMYSPDGHCRPFDKDAQGTLFSDGAGVVLLKRYKEALNDGDTIYGLIRGVAMNNDGLAKASFTAPSVEGQAEVISMAIANAKLSSKDITYVETHGTATPLGDPIEVEGLTMAFGAENRTQDSCGIGSVKSNFGHLTPAAGVAGLIKTLLAMQHKVIPATLHYKQNNPAINFSKTPFYVVDKNTPWNSNDSLKAGISSFGVGGTNAHVIVESFESNQPDSISRPYQSIVLSAKTESAIANRIEDLKSFLEHSRHLNVADLAYTLNTGRVAMGYKRSYVANSIEDLILQLSKPDIKLSGKRLHNGDSKKLVFMFPGQGSQYVNMGKNLYDDEPVFRHSVDVCAEILNKHLDTDIRTLLYPTVNKEQESERLLKETIYTQPALFTIGYSLFKLYESWGILPHALIGHSIGEFVCAVVAGIMSLDDALYLIANRGILMQNLPHGCMLSVRIGEQEAEKYLKPGTSVAAINGDALCVIAGPEKPIELIEKELSEKEIVHKRLHTSHAFHSPMMDEIVEPFANLVRKVKLNKARVPMMSTVHCTWLSDSEATNPMYWANHLRKAVRFAQGVKQLWTEETNYVMLELGPRNSASSLAMQQSSDLSNQVAIPSLGDSADDHGEWKSLMSALGKLSLHGIEPDWSLFYLMEKRKKVSLPGYPFDKIKHWVEAAAPSVMNQNVLSVFPFAMEMTSQASAPVQNKLTTSMSRKEQIQFELKDLLTDNSGIDFSDVDAETSFFEAGLDSLFLTQVALSVSKKYSVKVTFRQLNEDLSNIAALSNYLDSTISETYQPAVSNVATQSASNNDPLVQNTGASIHPQMINTSGMINDPMVLQNLLLQQSIWIQQQLTGVQSNQPNTSKKPIKHDPPKVEKSDDVKKEAGEVQKKTPFGAIARIEKFDTDQLNPVQKKWLQTFIDEYNLKYKTSKQFASDNKAHLADPRMVTGFRPLVKELIFQIVVNQSKGSQLFDLDKNVFIDVLNGFGSNILGHNPDVVIEALSDQLSKGYELGPMHPHAGELAKLICEFTQFDRAGFCNTGSEAVLGAMRIARTVTGRNLIVVFSNSYHGINDEVIVRPGKNFRSIPAAAGIMFEAVENVLVLDYGTEESLRIISERADELAAVMVEPIQSRRADFQPKEFLQKLREITTQHEIVYIFDEVITGFRLGKDGAQEYFGVKADIGAYGKICGGGMPIGVIAGKKKFMDALDGGFWSFGNESVPEVGVTYFAGTFVRHPFALAAGKAALSFIKSKGDAFYKEVNGKTQNMVNEINAFAHERKAPFHLVTFGTLFKTKWDVEYRNSDLLFYLLRFKGIHIWDGFPCFLTYAHSKEDIDQIIKAYKEAIVELQDNELMPRLEPLYSNGNGAHIEKEKIEIDLSKPPVPQAKLGKNPDGEDGWYIPDPTRPGKYMLYQS